jgi:hypothetical protein
MNELELLWGADVEPRERELINLAWEEWDDAAEAVETENGELANPIPAARDNETEWAEFFVARF